MQDEIHLEIVGEITKIVALPPAARFVNVVLLLALKDRATQVSLLPGEQHCGLTYVVNGRSFELVSAPFGLVQGILRLLGMPLDQIGIVGPKDQSGRQLRVTVGGESARATLAWIDSEMGKELRIGIEAHDVPTMKAGEYLQRYRSLLPQ
jgi:hypothetical protein